MNENWEERFNALMRDYLVSVRDWDVKRVTRVREEKEYGGGNCPTCSYEETVLKICYVDSSDTEQIDRLTMSMADLFRSW